MKFCFSSFWFVALVFSASASCARADSSWPCRSITRASRSAVSTRTSICPACTVSPSRTVICAHVARDLGLDRRLVDRLHRAGHRQPARQRLALDGGQVAGAELERRPAALSFRGLPAFFLAARSATAPADAADHQQHRPGRRSPSAASMRTPMTSPHLRRSSRRSARSPGAVVPGAHPVWMRRALRLDSKARIVEGALSPPYAVRATPRATKRRRPRRTAVRGGATAASRSANRGIAIDTPLAEVNNILLSRSP